MLLSAIVPTHDRPDVLRSCLQTLQAQDIDPRELEVVVIDDGSESDIAAVVSAVAAEGPVELRCERQALAGLNAARNRGVAVTDGELVAFLDDDTLVAPGWAAALRRAFDAQPCAAIGGRIELGLPGPAPAWMEEWRCYLAEYQLGDAGRWLQPADPVPVGANCAVRRGEFDRVGGFYVGLDRIGSSLVSNGDTEFFRRLRAAGGRLWYEPAASVVHCVPADRLTVSYFLRRHRAQGVSDELLLRLEGHSPSLGHRVGLMREVVGAATVAVRGVVRGHSPVRARLLMSYWRGRLSAMGMRPAPRVALGDGLADQRPEAGPEGLRGEA